MHFIPIVTLTTAIVFIVTTRSVEVSASCSYTCPTNATPVINPNHTKTSNGCGSKGIFVDAKLLPKPQLELCCNDHDFCYDTCNSGKDNCDLIFKNCMMNVCSTAQWTQRLVCKSTAELFYQVVQDFGCIPYLDSQKNACLCP